MRPRLGDDPEAGNLVLGERPSSFGEVSGGGSVGGVDIVASLRARRALRNAGGVSGGGVGGGGGRTGKGPRTLPK